MMLVNRDAIPTELLNDLKEIAVERGPSWLGSEYITDPETGTPAQELTDDQAFMVLDKITRKFWHNELLGHRVDRAARQAREETQQSMPKDPFAPHSDEEAELMATPDTEQSTPDTEQATPDTESGA